MKAPSRKVAVGTAMAVTAVLAVALPLFQPWRLFTDKVVDEAFPGAGPVSMTTSSPAPPTVSGDHDGATTATATPSPRDRPAEQPRSTAPVHLASGRFIGHEHGTSGRVAIVRLPDRSRVLRLEQLDTSDGPDLEVWLSDAQVVEGKAGWHVFDDGRHVSLGQLKGNRGNQNYAIPADVELSDFRSVSIWCNRFNVSFGAAALGTT